MQAIITVMLVLLSFAEAGLIAKAPRTEDPALQTPSQFYIITSTTTPSPTGTVVVIPPPTTTTTTTPTPTTTGSSNTMATPGAALPAPGREPDVANDPANHEPVTTAAPGNELDGVDGRQMKFVQTTYFACVTHALSTHCGWHEPILDTSAAAGTSRGEGLALRASLIAAFAFAVLAIGL
jgi:hypothetical protein